jgi:serine protease
VRSMIYAFRMKQIYLKTNGLKGANIVALNTSIGMDNAFPSDAPIWCSLYDSLGSVGILSSAATSNSDVDVAIKGDIPSTCPSKFMVVVNSTDVNDNHMSSGFSTKLVDLAAMGQNVYSTSLVKNAGANGPYGNHSGTSFAAPQVAGAIGLIYQHACDTFLKLAKYFPDSATKLAVEWILNGADIVPALNTKCFTGGRLNIYNAWKKMDQWCTAHDVPYDYKKTDLNNFVVYPSPLNSGDEVHVVFPRTVESGSIRLMSSDGRMLENLEFSNLSEVLMQTGNLSSGLYWLGVHTQNQRLVRKLLIY